MRGQYAPVSAADRQSQEALPFESSRTLHSSQLRIDLDSKILGSHRALTQFKSNQKQGQINITSTGVMHGATCQGLEGPTAVGAPGVAGVVARAGQHHGSSVQGTGMGQIAAGNAGSEVGHREGEVGHSFSEDFDCKA